MEFRYSKYKRLILLAILGLLLVVMSFLILICNPLEVFISKLIALKPNSIGFKMWKEPPYDVLAKVYVFKVTNSEEFLSGNEILQFKEVGPYVYKEKLFYSNATFNEDGTVSFIPRRTLHFTPELSAGDELTDTVIIPNVPLLGIMAALEDSSMIAKLAVSQIINVLDSQPFLNLTINDYLFGYDDALIRLANNFVPNWIDFGRFGIIDRLMALDNGSNIVVMNINSQEKGVFNEVLQRYAIQKWDGSPGMKKWGYKESNSNETTICNTVQGCFLGTMFPPHVRENSSFRLYRHGFCRPIPIKYEKRIVTENGFEGFLFRVEKRFLATTEEIPNNYCYCTKDKCLPSGVGDLSPCYYDIPVALSQPHFLNGDPALLKQVQGLFPDAKKHDSVLVIHPQMGVPLEARIRVQLNLNVPSTQFNSRTKPFNNLILPLIWVELIVDRPPWTIKVIIKLFYHFLPIVQEIVKYVSAVVGIGMVLRSATAVTFLYKNNCSSSDYLELPDNYSKFDLFSADEKLLETEV